MEHFTKLVEKLTQEGSVTRARMCFSLLRI